MYIIFSYHDLTLNISWDVTVSLAFISYRRVRSVFLVNKNINEIFFNEICKSIISHDTITSNCYLFIILFLENMQNFTNAVIDYK